MSKPCRTSYIRILFLLLALQIFTEARAQSLAVEISVDPTALKATVKGTFEAGFRPESGTALSFRRAVIGNEKLGDRIEDIALFSSLNGAVPARRVAPHQFTASSEFERFEYVVDLKPGERSAAAHASWLASDGGVLMLDDLLPLFGGNRKRQRVTLAFRLPEGWTSYSADDARGKDIYDVLNLEGSVIFVGRRFREIRVKSHGRAISLLLDGSWNFSDTEASRAVAEIYDAYVERLGRLPTKRSLVSLIKFPQAESAAVWEAETRGATVVIASSDVPFRDRSYQRMHEQMRHEIFHLWFPNAVDLSGDYAWFYEGAALYESLKLGIATGQVTFENYLDTLSRAYQIDSSVKARKPLIGAGHNEVYARGMLLAFLLDIRLMNAGKGGLAAALSRLVGKHKIPSEVSSAETALLSLEGARDLMEKYVTGSDRVDWSNELSVAGLKIEDRNGRPALAVESKVTGPQKAILKRLGYN